MENINNLVPTLAILGSAPLDSYVEVSELVGLYTLNKRVKAMDWYTFKNKRKGEKPIITGIPPQSHPTSQSVILSDYQIFKEKIQQIKNPRTKLLVHFLYGTGARINEALQVTKDDITTEEGFLLIKLKTEKNRSKPIRIIPISIAKENWITDEILKGRDQSQTLKIFNFTDRSARKWTNRDFGKHPHYFRHARITHLIQEFSLKESYVQQIMGWSSLAPLKVYSHLNWRDVAKNL